MKFYVDDGFKFKKVISAENPLDACCYAIRRAIKDQKMPSHIGGMFTVSERGFITERKDNELLPSDVRISTERIMQKMSRK